MIHSVREIRAAVPFYLTLFFNTGELVRVDLESKLRELSGSPDSKFRDLLNPDYFSKVRLNSEFDTVEWDNGIDLCPDVLYEMGECLSQKAESAAFF